MLRRGQCIGKWARDRGETGRGHKIWTKRETEILRRHYPDYKLLAVLLPQRSKMALWSAARYQRIQQKKLVFTCADVRRLRELLKAGHSPYASARIMRYTPQRIYYAISRHRLRIAKRPPKPARNPLIHAIRQRGHAFGLSPADLKAELGPTFAPTSRVGLRTVRKAVRLLDGKLIEDAKGARIVWND